MPDIQCPVAGCTYNTGDFDNAVAAALLMAHTAGDHSAGSVQQRRPPKVDRPQLADDINEEAWNAFQYSWTMFVQANGIADADKAVQLYSCCSTALKSKVTAIHHDILTKAPNEVLALLKTLTVIPVAVSVKRNELLQMTQDAGETIRTFFSRLNAKAVTCRFKVECTHAHADGAPARVFVDYTSEMIRHVVLNGLYDDEIRRDIFGHCDLDDMNATNLITLIESKETARDATSHNANNAVSQYKSRQKNDAKSANHLRKEKCRSCGNLFDVYRILRSGKYNKNPFVDCRDCWQKNNSNVQKKNHEGQSSDASAISFQITAVDSSKSSYRNDAKISGHSFNAGKFVLHHHIFQSGDWRIKLAQPHPTVVLQVSTKQSDYDYFKLMHPVLAGHTITAIVDSGAQCCLWGWNNCRAAGFKRGDLIPVKQKLTAVSKSRISIFGAVILRIYGTSLSGKQYSAACIVYISPDVSGFYLSQDAMIQLEIVPVDFPSVGAAAPSTTAIPVTEASGTNTNESLLKKEPVISKCNCPKRTLPPDRPASLPMPAIPENVAEMKEWLLHRYASSTFNVCPHQMLPTMKGPPIRIHVDPNAEPVGVRVAAKVPIHWEGQVKADLNRDEALGVIEKVPYGEPSKWCHRMVISPKHNGTLRRTIDLSPLNKHCVREVHGMKSPFELAKGIPPNTWRTVTDAWNGFHSIPLHVDDRHLTTFLSHCGPRYRYRVAPQGYSSSGDGYNRRCDEVFSAFERHKRCVDDNLHYDPANNMEEHWWRTIDFLKLCGENGIILNPDKLQFSEKVVDFAGFHLTETDVEPLQKYIDSIMTFPTPTTTTDIRAWFGLVNQVSHYAQLRDLIEPFRKFLSQNVKFYWDPDLNKIFNDSKVAIVDAIKEGVQIFDVTKRTCLRCDWSKEGIGFYLCQKHCSCESNYPDCCLDGWRITLCGSRFLKKSEERYAPIEGEALSVAWSLEQTKYFTMGCNDLIVVVDHKPLTKLLGDKTLDEIPNPRLFRLKQRTLPWAFEIYWMPGKSNSFSDATSRNPAPSMTEEEIDDFVSMINVNLEDSALSYSDGLSNIIATFKSELNKVSAITWERVQEATFSELSGLMTIIQKGFPNTKGDTDLEFLDFWDHKDNLYCYDHVIMYQDRVVIPPSLREEVLDSIHSAHQGISAMTLFAQSTVFWPGISHDIERTRKICRPCIRNAPSQSKMDPVPPIFPTTPFEAIASDYFKLEGWQYLVIADRLSGWSEAYHMKSSTQNSGSSGLITLLKNFFGTFGVPQELSSDGGPEYIANDTEEFLARWGVQHRLSAAYQPHSNGRAELAVKSMKRLIEDNVGPDGELDTDNFLRATLIKRNTPDPTCKLSPAEVVFGRRLRDTMPRINRNSNIFFNKQIQPTWTEAWEQKELALRTRYQGCQARLTEHSKSLPGLLVGDRVMIQNQSGNKPTKWDRSGVIVEIRDFYKYIVKVDGSGRLLLRNRRFLKKLHVDNGMFTSTKVVVPQCKPSMMHDQEQQETPHIPPLPTKVMDPKCRPTLDVPTQKLPTTTAPIPKTPTPVLDMGKSQSPVSNDPSFSTPVNTPERLNIQSGNTNHEAPNTNIRPSRLFDDAKASGALRPRREIKPRLFYDANTGTYIQGNPGNDIIDE